MKIPKKIDELLEKRCRLAFELSEATTDLDEWLDEHDTDLIDLTPETSGGKFVKLHCDLFEDTKKIRRYIEQYDEPIFY